MADVRCPRPDKVENMTSFHLTAMSNHQKSKGSVHKREERQYKRNYCSGGVHVWRNITGAERAG